MPSFGLSAGAKNGPHPGVDRGHNGDWDVYFREGIHLPAYDPSVLAGALIGATEHLGLTFTSPILQARPFDFARRDSTLDHLSGGRRLREGCRPDRVPVARLDIAFFM